VTSGVQMLVSGERRGCTYVYGTGRRKFITSQRRETKKKKKQPDLRIEGGYTWEGGGKRKMPRWVGAKVEK